MKTPILPLFTFLVFGFLLSSCGSLKEPQFVNIENVRLGRIGLTESTLTLNLHYYNPNNKRLKLKTAEGDAWVDGNPLGHFTIDTLINIPPLADFRLPVKMKMDMAHFVQNMAMATTGKEITLKVDGIARVGKGIIFINHAVHYEGKQKLGELLKLK